MDLSNTKESDFEKLQQTAMNLNSFNNEMVDVIAGNLVDAVSKDWILAENASHLLKALCSSDSTFSETLRANILTKLQAGHTGTKKLYIKTIFAFL